MARFDLSLAVGLAGAAFEAYLHPTGAEGMEHRTLSKCHTTFTDRAFLTEVYQGVLQIQLQSGSNLRVADITGASDPYVVLSTNTCTCTSKVINGSVNPKWNESMWLYARDVNTDTLRIRVYDSDFLNSDDDLGTAVVPLRALASSGTKSVDLDVALEGPGAGQGRIQLTLKLFSFKEYSSMAARMTAGSATMTPPKSKAPSSNQARPMDSPSGLGTLAEQVTKTLFSLVPHAPDEAPTEAELSPWRELAKAAGNHSVGASVPVAFVENAETDTQVCVASCCTSKAEA